MKKRVLIALSFLLGSCAAPTHGPFNVESGISDELNRALDTKRSPADTSQVQQALLPPLSIEMPQVPGQPIEPRFDLAVNGAPAKQVFMSIVSGTRYSMLVHPEVAGTISVNLKDVSVQEALESIREIYGYEYRVDGTRIYVQPAGIQSRVFRVNYLIGQRNGRSDIRVTSSSVTDTPNAGGAGVPGAAGVTSPGVTSGTVDSSRIQTQTSSDFWEDLRRTLQTIVGAADGRSVVVNPQAGVVVVRAMPPELRNVEAYLKAIRASVERQVMLEAKIIEVTLSEQFQAGVNWALFSTNRKAAGGQLNPNTTLGTTGGLSTASGPPSSAGTLAANLAAASLAASGTTGTLLTGNPGGALLGLAFQTQNFAALLQFLETQGLVQVLSSPRIATLNNQKAVLKVGTDEFFLTNISGGSSSGTGVITAGASTTFPTLTLRPFFSGVALDVTPQIDQGSSIILHVHPSVSDVQQDNRTIDLGTTFGGAVSLPLARSTVSETDSVVKVVDGNIVAIGGLMKVDVDDERSGIPGVQDIPAAGSLFRSRSRTSVKKELVILIKPTVIQSDYDSNGDIRQARERIMNFGPPAAAEKN
ncbi:MAG TPA: secretin N-terminal domain-containing protein [Burkholderiales bacterium]|nr:secretin N-terminal domain-containing protein [Burkholderiales bacterium]